MMAMRVRVRVETMAMEEIKVIIFHQHGERNAAAIYISVG
jgi:hypothetical protein